MAFNKFNDNKGGFAPRPMIKGDWKCSQCGTAITELPFEPAPDRPIYCKDCWRKMRDEKGGGKFSR